MSKGRAYAIERIKHMIAAANTINGYTKRGRSAFDTDSTVRDAILYQLIVIGEASKGTTAADDSIARVVQPWNGRSGPRCVIESLINIGQQTTRLSG